MLEFHNQIEITMLGTAKRIISFPILKLLNAWNSRQYHPDYKPIPLSWIQLYYNRPRIIVAIAGIAFATLLMFMQLGFQGALYKTATDIHNRFLADLVLIGPRTENFFDAGLYQTFTMRYLTQALSTPGVKSIAPLYIGFGHWKNPISEQSRQILIFGFDPDRPTFDLPELKENLELIKRDYMILFDVKSKEVYGPIEELFAKGHNVTTEINNKKVQVGGLFSMGGSIFSADGIVFTSDLNFSRIVQRSLRKVSAGFIILDKGADRNQVLTELKDKFSGGVKVLTLEDYMLREKGYWKKASPIGSIFTIGTIMGFIVGLVIVYQVFYSQINDNLGYYATMKALGYGGKYFTSLIVQQSIILSVLGYLPGFFLSMILYGGISYVVRLPAQMEAGRAIVVFTMTIFMCIVAGLIATRRLREADPADIF